jgi:predicted nucleic acid-binding protein
MVLCDSNIFIEVYRRNSNIIDIIERIGRENIAVSDITRGELFYGAINKRELRDIREDLNELYVIPVSPNVSTMAIRLVREYCLSHKLHTLDALIAATAIYHKLELFTLNLKDFTFIPGVQLYRPS